MLLLMMIGGHVFGQQGAITGNISDENNGEELIGVTVVIEGTTKGAVSDVFGNYRINTDAGTYNLIFSYVSYATRKVEGVVVEEGKTTTINMTLAEDVQQLEEIVVTAEAINNNEIALLKLQKKALAVQDGISSSEMQRIGVTNSAESMRQVTGASVEGGKYVVMRGLGDRYSLTQMNGITMPSTDPYRNASSMDLIPSSMVDNIVTTKSFTPDQPGNFTGGNVNVETKSLPDQFYLTFGVGLTYNTNSSFQNQFITDPVSGSADVLGYDNGTRARPSYWSDPANFNTLSDPSIYIRVRNVNEANDAERALFNDAAKQISPEMIPTFKRSTLDNRYAIGLGNRKELSNGGILGYNVGVRMSRNWDYFDNYQVGIYEYSTDANATDLNTNLDIRGPFSEETTNIGSLASVAYQYNTNNEISADYFYNHDGTKTASSLAGKWPGAISGTHDFFSRSIAFTERELHNVQLRGTHQLNELNASTMDWVVGYVNSSQYEPDVRIFANDRNTTGYNLNKAEYDLPFHFWRNLQDHQVNAKIDFTTAIGSENVHRLKYGLWFSGKDRTFNETRIQLANIGAIEADDQYTSFREANGDYPAFFNPNTNMGILGTPGTGHDGRNEYVLGNYYLDVSKPDNRYTGNEFIGAGYTMTVLELGKDWRSIIGARLEATNFRVQSANPNNEIGEIKKIDVLPSATFIKAVNDNTNLRFAGSRTIARPNMRELAPFSSVDLIGGYFFVGNPNLKRTLIDNIDMRYEVYPGAGELIAASIFFKNFHDPIVRVLNPVASGGQVSFENTQNAILGGLELEYRKNLGEHFKTGINFTYTHSEVKLTSRELAAREAVLAGTGIQVETTRPFQAQSPYIVNFILTYANPDAAFESTIFLNAFGRRLSDNGFGSAPDVYEIYGTNPYEIPTPTINWTFSKAFGERFETTLRFLNILNPIQVRNQFFNGTYYNTQAIKEGMGIMVGVTYNVFDR